MARIPWLEGIWGQDVLARQHRLVGFTSFHLMLVHIVTITLGYAAAAQTGVLHEIWLLVTVYPGMLLATAGTAALVAVVVTSIRAARRRMRYESWHLIHLYAYLGVGLGAAASTLDRRRLHRVPGGNRLLVGAVGRRRPGAAAVAVRHAAGPQPSAPDPGARGRARIHGTSSRSSCPAPTWTGSACRPASSVSGGSWAGPAGPGRTPSRCPRSRPPTGCGSPSAPPVTAPGRLTALRPGAHVVVEGPYGIMNAARRDRRDVLLIAAGVGVTTMRGLAESVLAEDAAVDGAPGMASRRPSVVLLHRCTARRTRCSTRSSRTWRAAGTCGCTAWSGAGRRSAAGGAAARRSTPPPSSAGWCRTWRTARSTCAATRAWMTQVQQTLQVARRVPVGHPRRGVLVVTPCPGPTRPLARCGR